MSYTFGHLAGEAIFTAVDHHKRTKARARWHSPLGRLGRCGILSLRQYKSTVDCWRAVHDAAGPGWRFALGVDFGGVRVPERLLVFAGGAATVLEAILGDDHVCAVHRVDQTVAALRACLGHPDLPIAGVVCRTDTSEEPRSLPAPSGSPVTVTGLPWLPGLLRARLGQDHEEAVPEGLVPSFNAALWRAAQQDALYYGTIRRFPHWWSIPDLRLDDGQYESIDLVAAGPTGVIVADLSGGEPNDRVERLSRQTQRLRAYLPQAEVLPVIVTDSVGTMQFGPQTDMAGYPVAWLNPSHFLEFAQEAARRGLRPDEITLLNAPAQGWYRKVERPGETGVAWGWTS